MKLIPVGKDQFAKVDDEDYERLLIGKWQLDSKGYAYLVRMKKGEIKRYRMHRLVIDCGKQILDHINLDKLDNRKSNLRIATIGQNNQNKPKRVTNHSGYKGVRLLNDKFRNKKWRVEIIANGKRVHVGLFATAEDAALAYNQAALKYHKEFACLNDVNV